MEGSINVCLLPLCILSCMKNTFEAYTTTYCYPTTMVLPQQPSPYHLHLYILLPYNHAATPTTKSLSLQLHTATLQPCCYPNNQVPTLTTTYCYPTTMLLPQQPSPYPYTTTYCYPATMLLPQQPSPYPYNYILLPYTTMLLPQQPSPYPYNYILLRYNHAATPTTKSLPLQLHTATLQPCCHPNNQVPILTTTYCYPTTMLLPQQPSPYPYNYILLPYNHAATPTTKSLPVYNYILLPCNHAATPTTKSLSLQLHTATLQPCCYPNNQVPTLTTTYCYPIQPCCYPNNQVPTLTTTYCYATTMLLPQQPSPYPYNYILLRYNHAATPTTKSLPLQLHILLPCNHAATPQPSPYPYNYILLPYTTMLLPQEPCR